MSQDSFPRPVSDPESDGIPEYADDDSSARDDLDATRAADGLDPAALPSDRPLAVNHFGTTAEEARLGESLDLKVNREVSDPALAPVPDARADATATTGSAETFDADPLEVDQDLLDPETALDEEDEPVDPHLDSPVSMYDRPLGNDDVGQVGRIVEPDEGGGEDTEKDMIAYDAGASGGGATAEELAMHEIREP